MGLERTLSWADQEASRKQIASLQKRLQEMEGRLNTANQRFSEVPLACLALLRQNVVDTVLFSFFPFSGINL